MSSTHKTKSATATPPKPPHKKIAVIGNQALSLINFRGLLIKEMVSRGHHVFALAPDYTPESRAAVTAFGATPVDISLARTGMNPVRDMIDLLRMAKQLRALKPDVTFAYFIKPVIYGTLAASLASVHKRYAMIEGAGYVFIDSSQPSRRRRFLRQMVTQLYRAGLGRAHRVFMLNPDDRDLFVGEHMVNPNKVRLIDGIGLDLDHYSSSPTTTNPVSFIMVARLLREKGIQEFIDAARRVKTVHPEVSFFLVGSVDSNPGAVKEPEVQSWVKDGLVEWPGQVTDVRPWIAKASVFVLPSYREGLPRSTQEAMAMGRAVITTDVPGCRQTVENGVNGLIVPARNAEALSKAMLTLIERPELVALMGAASRRIAEERFDVHRINSQLLKEMGL
ncbi:MAG: glycosyltransferase family 1 protein [Anaerolinea sp.]|nr:glycosyltransferase family 1 protein [Anaerolinea sp.]